MKYLIVIVLLSVSIMGCDSDDTTSTTPAQTIYFPSKSNDVWEAVTPLSLGWNETAIQPLKDYLFQKHTKSFMILVNGRIVMEEYFNGHTQDSIWQWNSAGKTLVATTIGIAEQHSFLNIDDKVTNYLGVGWTSEPLLKENLITVRHLLTMTSGINDSSELVIKKNLTYLADAGSRWSYHNVFQKLMDVVADATNQDFELYFNTNLKDRIGMDGFWNNGLIFKIYHSNTRSMARFGLLALAKGQWNGEQIINEPFFNESITTSQSINPSYGYLWWLNGKSSFMVPGGQTIYQGELVPNAPSDMFAAMGADDQRIYVIPSKNMVVVRIGDASDPENPNFAVSGFDDELWSKINDVIE